MLDIFNKQKIRDLEQELEEQRQFPCFEFTLVTDANELLRLGDKASALLDHETFSHAVMQMLDELERRIKTSQPEQIDLREHSYHRIKAIQDIYTKLNGYANDAILLRLEMEKKD